MNKYKKLIVGIFFVSILIMGFTEINDYVFGFFVLVLVFFIQSIQIDEMKKKRKKDMFKNISVL